MHASFCILTNHDEIQYNPRMVVRSGNENIVRYNRGWTLTLQVVGWLLILGAVVALGGALLGQVGWEMPLYFGGMGVPTAGLLFVTARPFSRSFVAIGPEGVRLGLLKCTAGSGYATWTPLQEQRFKWEEVWDITYDGDKGVCRFRAGSHIYELTDNNSPSPRTVAKLMAERKGVQLPAQELLVPTGDRPMPRLTQAAIMGGISIPLMGAVASGALWMHSRGEGPHFEAEFGALTALGLLSISLFVTAIALVVIERTHRL